MTYRDNYSNDSSSEEYCRKKNKCDKKCNKKCCKDSDKKCDKKYSKDCCKVSNKFAKKIECFWRKYFCDALLLPKIGYPSCDKGVATLIHGSHIKKNMKLDGLESKSILANKALYSFECSNGKYINLYETMISDIPGKCGKKSTAEVFVQALCNEGLTTSGDHYHWKGASILKKEHGIYAIHIQKINMNPIEFSKKLIKSLLKYECAVKKALC